MKLSYKYHTWDIPLWLLRLLKRRMREAYRLQKELLGATGIDLLLAYSHPEVADFATLYAEVTEILGRIQAKMENASSFAGSTGESPAV